MTFTWKPSSCDCKIEYDNNEIGITQANQLSIMERCNLHRVIPDVQFTTVVLAHARAFDVQSFPRGSNPNEVEQEQIAQENRDERNRIRNL